MSLFYKLTGVTFNKVAQAASAANQFLPFRPLIEPYRYRLNDGSTEVRYAIRLPAGLRLAGLEKQLKRNHPQVAWELVSIDADGFETALQADQAGAS